MSVLKGGYVMVMLNIVVAIFCAALLVFLTYKHCGKRGHDRQEDSNRESSGGRIYLRKAMMRAG